MIDVFLSAISGGIIWDTIKKGSEVTSDKVKEVLKSMITLNEEDYKKIANKINDVPQEYRKTRKFVEAFLDTDDNLKEILKRGQNTINNSAFSESNVSVGNNNTININNSNKDKKHTDYIIEMYKDCFKTAGVLEKLLQTKSNEKQDLANEFIKCLEKCQVKVLMFGDEQENKLMNNIVLFAQKNAHIKMKNEFANLMRKVSSKYRSILGLQELIF